MERTEIGRGTSFKLQRDVAAAGSVLHWEIVSTDYDIAFGLSVVSEGQKQDVVSCLVGICIFTNGMPMIVVIKAC